MSFSDMFFLGVGFLLVFSVPVSVAIGLYCKGRKHYWQYVRTR